MKSEIASSTYVVEVDENRWNKLLQLQKLKGNLKTHLTLHNCYNVGFDKSYDKTYIVYTVDIEDDIQKTHNHILETIVNYFDKD